MKLWIETLGCKVNTYESEVIKKMFLDAGYTYADNFNEADVVIVNTCSVTSQSDSKSRKVIRKIKRENPSCILAVCGCSSQNHKEEYLPLGIDILIGNKDKSKLVSLVDEFKDNNEPISVFYDLMKSDFEEMYLDSYTDRTRAFVKIQDGCNNYCTYCIIPYLRGTLRNKDFDEAVKEINTLADNGFKEIVLTGIHTGSYPNLTKLLHEISLNPNLERIRISSIEITELDDEFMEELRVNDKICNHIHIPVQCASNNVLKAMNRKYDMDKFFEIINKLRSVRTDINITTDLIVGFPTETDEDFEECISNAEKLKFGKIHTFPYSPREGTAAYRMKNIVSDKAKDERTHRMLELSDKLENEYYNKFLNSTVNVLIEEVFDNESVGHTSNYIKIHVNKTLEHNKNYLVKITKIDGINVYGELIEE